MNAKNIEIKIDCNNNAPGFFTFINPITGKIENCRPNPNWIIPKTGILLKEAL